VTIALAVLSIIFAFASLFLAVVVPVIALLANRDLVLRNVDRHVSATPVVGTIIGFFALVLAPIGTLGQRIVWCWVPVASEAIVLGCCVAYWNLSGLRNESERQRRSRQR
jgi:hypothetical protein